MKKQTSKRRKSEKTIALIMDAATRLFVNMGYHGASIAAISEASNLTKGALYSHFAGKSDLLAALIGKFEREFLDELILAVNGTNGDAVDKLHRFVSFSAEFAARNQDLCLLLTTVSMEPGGCEPEINRELRRLYGKYAEFLKEVVDEGKAQGVLSSTLDGWSLAYTIIAVHDGILLGWRRNRDSMNVIDYVRTFRRVLIKGAAEGLITDRLNRQRGED